MSGLGEDELRELVAALKHDLAKYVAWRSANFDDEAWSAPLEPDFVAALQADVLQTKGEAAAWEVWETLNAPLGGSFDHPELETVDQAVATLRQHGEVLRAGAEPLAAVCGEIRDAQRTIRTALRDLQRRLGRG